jgi:hypothetical protein
VRRAFRRTTWCVEKHNAPYIGYQGRQPLPSWFLTDVAVAANLQAPFGRSHVDCWQHELPRLNAIAVENQPSQSQLPFVQNCYSECLAEIGFKN